MIREEKFLIFAAHSTHMVMRTEKLLNEKGIECRVIPLPSEISASCGLSIRTAPENKERVEELLKEAGIEMDCYTVEKVGFKKRIDKC